MSRSKNARGPQAAPRCERCGKPLTLTKSGSLRKGKRFCGTACQQANIRDARVVARNEVALTLRELGKHSELAQVVAQLARALQTLGMFTPEQAEPSYRE